jgi:hypothetical protein
MWRMKSRHGARPASKSETRVTKQLPSGSMGGGTVQRDWPPLSHTDALIPLYPPTFEIGLPYAVATSAYGLPSTHSATTVVALTTRPNPPLFGLLITIVLSQSSELSSLLGLSARRGGWRIGSPRFARSDDCWADTVLYNVLLRTRSSDAEATVESTF